MRLIYIGLVLGLLAPGIASAQTICEGFTHDGLTYDRCEPSDLYMGTGGNWEGPAQGTFGTLTIAFSDQVLNGGLEMADYLWVRFDSTIEAWEDLRRISREGGGDCHVIEPDRDGWMTCMLAVGLGEVAAIPLSDLFGETGWNLSAHYEPPSWYGDDTPEDDEIWREAAGPMPGEEPIRLPLQQPITLFMEWWEKFKFPSF